MKMSVFILLQTLVLISIFHLHVRANDDHRQSKTMTYVVHMDKATKPTSFSDHFNWYDTSLKSVSGSENMVYTYTDAVHGFSARLTAKQAKQLETRSGVLSVIPEARYELHTTRSPDFLGIRDMSALFPESEKLGDVVVGVLDTGAWPESKSFDDSGMGPVPSSWRGKCEVGKGFNSSSCNRKLIGARFFSRGYEQAYGAIDDKVESRSPRDDDGHGTHTSTTAAGSATSDASLFGFAAGTARGMAPAARVATYKVCWLGGCFGSDILAGIDAAVHDGVDVLSLSIGGSLGAYHSDVVAIGAFAAMEHSIVVSVSAGNGGPGAGSLTNVAPWMITVGAGTLDRDFPAYVALGNGERYKGVSLYGGKPLAEELIPIIYARSASNSSTNGNLCLPGSLIPSKATGRIVVCDRGGNSRAQKGEVVRDAGGAGMVLANTENYGEELVADSQLLPAATVGKKIGNLIKTYIRTMPNPTATIVQGGTKLGVQPSPVVAAFSSRGPNLVTPEILKPDLIAPGVNILAGWTGEAAPTGLAGDKRRVTFNIVSGTSMSCPHVSGLAALIKSAHRDWSPAAIRSALMTTSYSTYKDNKPITDIATGNPANAFDYGAGHVDPVAALDPGLVYDTTMEDYIGLLCALNYTKNQIRTLAKGNYNCDPAKKYSLRDFNYPSFAVPLETALESSGGGADVSTTVKYTRTLTNVGTPGTYKVSVSSDSPKNKISVEPESLSFGQANEKKTYTVTFTAESQPSGSSSFARLEWSDGKHIVGSPIAFSWT